MNSLHLEDAVALIAEATAVFNQDGLEQKRKIDSGDHARKNHRHDIDQIPN
jgi:hypothetical protein